MDSKVFFMKSAAVFVLLPKVGYVLHSLSFCVEKILFCVAQTVKTAGVKRGRLFYGTNQCIRCNLPLRGKL